VATANSGECDWRPPLPARTAPETSRQGVAAVSAVSTVGFSHARYPSGIKYQPRGLKADFMFAEVTAVLDLIPRKAHSA
jgi:hypothetical protein